MVTGGRMHALSTDDLVTVDHRAGEVEIATADLSPVSVAAVDEHLVVAAGPGGAGVPLGRVG